MYQIHYLNKISPKGTALWKEHYSLTEKIKLEAERRCCGDNSIVNYANATFYPKMVADVTTGTATTAQTLYNPLPKCGECCNGN